MPKTLPLLTLPHTAFTQCSMTEEVTSISIYDTRQVEVSTRHKQKITIQPYDLSWPQFSNIADFIAYLKVCHFQLRQLNNGEYKLISLVKGLGGGVGLSSLKDLSDDTALLALKRDILNEARNMPSPHLTSPNSNLPKALIMNLANGYKSAQNLTNYTNDNLSMYSQHKKGLHPYCKLLDEVRGHAMKALSITYALISKQAKPTTEMLIQSKHMIENLLDALIIMADDEFKNPASYRTFDDSCSFQTLNHHLLQAKELAEKLYSTNVNSTQPKAILRPSSKNETTTGSLQIVYYSTQIGINEAAKANRVRSSSISGHSSSSRNSSDTETPDIPNKDETTRKTVTSQENLSWLISRIPSQLPTDSKETTSYRYLSQLLNRSPIEYRQSVENNESEEITAIQQKIAELTQSILTMKQKSKKQQTEIKEIQTHQKELEQITANLREKEAFKAKVHNFLKLHASYPQVQAFYDTFLTQTSASFLALFLLRNSGGLMAAKPGAILDKTKQGNTKSNLLTNAENGINRAISAEHIINWAEEASHIITKIAKNAPHLIHQAATFLKNVTTTLPFIGLALTGVKMVIDQVMQVDEKDKLANTDTYMSSLTPKVIEQIAHYLAFHTTFAYVNQIKRLTSAGAHTFAECGVNRLIIGLLNGDMNKYERHGIRTAALATLRLSSVSQNSKKLFGFAIPWTYAKLGAQGDLKVTEEELYQNCGVQTIYNVQQYINNENLRRDLSRDLGFMRIDQAEFEIFSPILIKTNTAQNDRYTLIQDTSLFGPLQRSDAFHLPSADSSGGNELEVMKKRLAEAEKRLAAIHDEMKKEKEERQKEKEDMLSVLNLLKDNVYALGELHFVAKNSQDTTNFHTKITTQIDTAVQSKPVPLSPTIKEMTINFDIAPQDIPTLGDGNCAFNAIAIGICHLIRQDLKDKSNEKIQILQEKLSSYVANLEKWLKPVIDWNDLQKTLAPILRQLAIDEIRKQDDVIGPLYKARLWHTYTNQSLKDDTFIVHPHIKEKFKKPNLTENGLNTWWDKKGRDQYFHHLSLSQTVQGVPNKARWGSDIEIEFLALLFDINIKYITGNYSKTLGIGSGMISADFTEDEKERLSSFNLIETKINCWTLRTFETREALETKIAEFAPLTSEEMKVLNSLLQTARQFPDVSEYNDLKQKLIRLGILNKYKDKYTDKEIFLFIDKDGADTINKEGISNYAQGINDTLKAKLLKCYEKNLPTFTLQHSGNHWEYKGT